MLCDNSSVHGSIRTAGVVVTCSHLGGCVCIHACLMECASYFPDLVDAPVCRHVRRGHLCAKRRWFWSGGEPREGPGFFVFFPRVLSCPAPPVGPVQTAPAGTNTHT